MVKYGIDTITKQQNMYSDYMCKQCLHYKQCIGYIRIDLILMTPFFYIDTIKSVKKFSNSLQMFQNCIEQKTKHWISKKHETRCDKTTFVGKVRLFCTRHSLQLYSVNLHRLPLILTIYQLNDFSQALGKKWHRVH